MSPIETYVFLDLKTTGIPAVELNKTKITEISLIAVKRCHFLETRNGDLPRVQQKLCLCLNPGKAVDPASTKETGLCNSQLEYEPRFNRAVADQINGFLGLLTEPVCLFAEKGRSFHFPILKKHMQDVGVSFPAGLLCADSFPICNSETCVFEEYNEQVQDGTVDNNYSSLNSQNALSHYKQREGTPKRISNNSFVVKTPRKLSLKKIGNVSKARRHITFSDRCKLEIRQQQGRLCIELHTQVHRAEDNCMDTLKSGVAFCESFNYHINRTCTLFSSVIPMTIGIPLTDNIVM